MRGCELLKASLRVPGVECVAVCDLWEGRLTAAQETLKKTVATTRNYKEILDRKDIDAVIVAVTDHQHRRVVVDACAAGKDVYCEKPLSHTVDDGFAMIAAAQKNNRILQVGSQRVSSILYEKAREIYASGKLGEVCCIEAYWDRNSASGAWVYPIPPGVNDQNIDWTAFLTGAPSIPFDPVTFLPLALLHRLRRRTRRRSVRSPDLGNHVHHRNQLRPPRARNPLADSSAGRMAASSPT